MTKRLAVQGLVRRAGDMKRNGLGGEYGLWGVQETDHSEDGEEYLELEVLNCDCNSGLPGVTGNSRRCQCF